MAHKKSGAHPPVPKKNQSPMGPDYQKPDSHKPAQNQGAGFAEQDPKRRLGDFTGKGEHAIQQPSALNDGAGKRS